MCNDLLPDSMNAFLDDVETGLCLPILLLILLCTIQFIMNHTLDIACSLASLTMKKNNDGDDTSLSNLTVGEISRSPNYSPKKLKGMLSHIGTCLLGTWGCYRNNQLPSRT